MLQNNYKYVYLSLIVELKAELPGTRRTHSALTHTIAKELL